ncbi:hypothetical protein [Chryseobacterium culicis]|uniref:Uncharacterized protein n=1 Tax=Chryseobacterium culicis TaxID=680127 RepID=A0A1H6I0P5_CHRCI|nr:hypothetical protein [Chryseobacterium culicis]SEH40990.1 hypothetical protein SAMN05421593_3869 [Chryseobacterium culicis]
MKLLPRLSNKVLEFLKSPYKPLDNQVSIRVIPILAIFPFAGFIYLVFYMNKFGVGYESLYFNVNDCIAILYEKSVLFFLIAILLIGASLPLLSVIISFLLEDEKKEEFKNWQILIFVILCLGILVFTFYEFKVIPKRGAFWLSILLFLAILIYLFKSKIEGIVMGAVCFMLFCVLYAVTDAESRKKEKPKFDVVLKDDNKPLKILSETDSCRYFIRKTSDYIFIMDSCKNKVITYPTSDLKSASFTP